MWASSRGRLLGGVLFLVVLGFLFLFGTALRGKGAGPLTEGPAPNFTLQLFEGGTISLEELRDEIVVINFWAAWCVYCREEAPILERSWQAYKGKGVTFIGVNWMDVESEAQKYLLEFAITYPNGPDLGGKIGRAYGVQGVPETYIVDQEGNLAHTQIGPLDEATLVGVLESLLDQPHQ